MTNNKRPEPVDLSAFDGMTPGEWGSVYNVSNKFTIWAGPKAEYIGVMYKRKDAESVAAIPPLVADLKATRTERNTLLEFVEQMVEDMTCKTNPKLGAIELVMCTPINTVELFNKARALLAGMEESK